MTDLAIMGIIGVLPMLLTFWRLYRQAKRDLLEERPDAVVLIDFPGFNWHVARAAKRLGIPVFYFMPPQLWAWAPWRIRKVRRSVDYVLSGLTFERDWYAARGVDATYVGHPFFDEVADHPIDHEFLETRRTSRGTSNDAEKTIRNVAILPGSRHLEVTRNGPALVQVIRNLAERHPDVVFRVACYKELHRTLLAPMCESAGVTLPVELCVGKTSEIVELADCCLLVSGSVSLELLARRTPAVVIYKGGPLTATLAKWVLTCKYITLPNLLADREIMPEHFYSGDDAPVVAAITRQLDTWLSDDASLAAKRREMENLASVTAKTGATARAADAIVSRVNSQAARAAA
jgi:lipid-A-disaccharide synthase